MDFKDITGVLGSLAPSLATAIAGPLAGSAVTALEGVFGITPTGTMDDRQAALAGAIGGATADQLAAVRKADNEFKLQMQALGFKNIADLEAIASNDRDSARKREIAVKDYTPQVLAYGITIGFFGILIFMLIGQVPAGSKDILNILLGVLGSSWSGVIAYFFGSSSGSAEKTKLLAQADAIKPQ